MRIAVPAALSPAALRAHDARAPLVDLGGETMGTRWTVRMAARPATDIAAVRRSIAARLDGIVAQMSQWQATSRLSRFNRAPAGSWTLLPADFAAVVAAALAVAAASGGAFDPTMGRLSDLWGFGATPQIAPPDAADLAAALSRSGWRRLAFAPAARWLCQPGGLWLDLSGIAKGYAVDAVAALLEVQGIHHCLVEIGGELVGRGLRPDRDPWWVDLEAPPGTALAPLRVAAHQLAIATSGHYRRGDHTLDPRTGRAAAMGVIACSVIATTAMAADAWATALTVLGPDAGVALATEHGIAARLVTAAGEHLTPALAAMLD